MNIKSMSVVFVSFALLALGAMAQSFQPHWDSLGENSTSTSPLCYDGQNVYYDSGQVVGMNTTLYKWNRCDGFFGFASFFGSFGNSGVIADAVVAGDSLYVVGSFESVGCANGQSLAATNIIRCNLSTGQWSDLGFSYSGGDGEIFSVTVDKKNNVYVALGSEGYTANGMDPNILMKYDGTNWASVGGGLLRYQGSGPAGPNEADRMIRKLATDGTNIFAMGGFIGGYNGSTFVHSPLFIKWDGIQWCSMGGLMQVAAIDGYFDISSTASMGVLGTNIFVAGRGIVSAKNIANNQFVNSVGVARFSTVSGEVLPCDGLTSGGGLGPNGFGNALVVHSGKVFLGGYFDHVGSTAANGLAVWTNNSSHWGPVGGGVTDQSIPSYPGEVTSLASGGNAILVKGVFDHAGNLVVNHGDTIRWMTGADPFCPPVLNNDHLNNGAYSFDISGPSGSSWQVYRGEGWGDWTLVGTVVLANGSATFTDYSIGSLNNYEDVSAGYYQLQNASGSSGIIGFNKVTLPADGSGSIQWIANPFYYQNSSINSVIPLDAFTGADPSLIMNGGVFLNVANPIIGGWNNWDISNLGDGWYFGESDGSNWQNVSADTVTFSSGDSLLFYNNTGYGITFILHGLGYGLRDN